MVLNLLQRFSLDEAKELILKSFGYFSSGSRLKPLLDLQGVLDNEIKERMFVCPLSILMNSFLNMTNCVIFMFKTGRLIRRYANRSGRKNRPLSPEAVQFGKETKAMLEKNALLLPVITVNYTKNTQKVLKLLKELMSNKKTTERNRTAAGYFLE